MRSLLILGALFGGIAFVANSAEAQRGPFGGGAFGNPGGAGMLMMNKGVQKELKLTEDQTTKFEDIQKESRSKFEEAYGKFKSLPQEEGLEKMQKMFKEVQESTQKELMRVLTADQTTRLKQIERQQNVAQTLTQDEDVKKELKLSEDQTAKVKTISEDLAKEQLELRPGQEKISALVKEANTKAADVLDKDQKETWKKLTGEPFEVKFEFGFKKKMSE